jgi:putative hemolysin
MAIFGMEKAAQPTNTTFTYAARDQSNWVQRAIGRFENLTGKRLRTLLQEFRGLSHPVITMPDFYLNRMETPLHLTALGAPLPPTGPLIVAANHPFGITDGMAMLALMVQARTNPNDIKFMAYDNLVKVPEFGPHLLPVRYDRRQDQRDEVRAVNTATKIAAATHLASGGALLIFPSGGIATTREWRDILRGGPASELPWRAGVAELATLSGAPIVPCHIKGQCRPRFHAASKIGLGLRLALLMSENVATAGKPLSVVMGQAISADHLTAQGADARAQAAWLQRQVEGLAAHHL